MRKDMRSIVALAFAGLLAVGCVDASSSDDDPALGQAEQALGSAFKLTEYWTDASHTVRLGYCVGPSVCSGGSTVCSGSKSAFSTFEWEDC
jgi:hypothetical protein